MARRSPATLARGVESIPALLVSIEAPRLRRLGIGVPASIATPEHRLFEHLRAQNPDVAHSR